MEIQNCFTHKSSAPETNSGICNVDRLGYVSAQKRIEQMILAGMRLVNSRREEFDFPDGNINEDFYDPTRNPNFDYADATQMSLAYEAKKREWEALKASQTAQESPIDPPVTTT